MGRIGRIALLFAIAASLLATALPASASSRSKMSSSEVAGRAKAIAAATFNASSPAEGQKIWRDGMQKLAIDCGCPPPCLGNRKFGQGPADPNGNYWFHTELDYFGSGNYPACSWAYTSSATTTPNGSSQLQIMSGNMNLRWWKCGTAQNPAFAQRVNVYNPSVSVPSTSYGGCGPQADNYQTRLYYSFWYVDIWTTSSLYLNY